MSGGFRVSDSTIETAARAIDCRHTDGDCVHRDDARRAIEAAVPSLVAEIREQIAGEVRGLRDDNPSSLIRTALTVVADTVARGDAG